MKKTNLVFFGLDVLFVNGAETFSPEISGLLNSEDFLKTFLAVESDPDFTWSRVSVLASRRDFQVHGIFTGKDTTKRTLFANNIIWWFHRQNKNIGRIFLLKKPAAEDILSDEVSPFLVRLLEWSPNIAESTMDELVPVGMALSVVSRTGPTVYA